MEATLDRVAAMLGHRPNSSLEFYVRDAKQAAFRGIALELWRTCQFPGGQTCNEARRRASPLALFEPGGWDFAENIQTARLEQAATNGLLRSWSDLDRTGALAAHLAALDRTLERVRAGCNARFCPTDLA